MVAESRTARGARGCTEMNLLFKKNRKKKKKTQKKTRKKKSYTKQKSKASPAPPASSLGDHFPSGETGWERGTRNRIRICLEVGRGSERWLAKCKIRAPAANPDLSPPPAGPGSSDRRLQRELGAGGPEKNTHGSRGGGQPGHLGSPMPCPLQCYKPPS